MNSPLNSSSSSRRRLVLSLPVLAGVLALAACGGGGGSGGSGGGEPSWAELSGSNSITALTMTDTTVGTGATALVNQRVSVSYTGWLYDKRQANNKGTQFDTSVGQTPPSYSFVLGATTVIKGWDQGVVGMKVGGKRTLQIPASLGYGADGRGAAIPPNAALIFEVELLAIIP